MESGRTLISSSPVGLSRTTIFWRTALFENRSQNMLTRGIQMQCMVFPIGFVPAAGSGPCVRNSVSDNAKPEKASRLLKRPITSFVLSVQTTLFRDNDRTSHSALKVRHDSPRRAIPMKENLNSQNVMNKQLPLYQALCWTDWKSQYTGVHWNENRSKG
jgi:hypothetical protein